MQQIAEEVDGADTHPDPDAFALILQRRALLLETLKLESPLDAEATGLARSLRFLASTFGDRASGRDQAARREHAMYVANRQMQGQLLSARAQCVPDRSRDQDDAWKSAAIAALAEHKLRLTPCFKAEVARRSKRPPPGELKVKIYVEESGKPSLVAPADLSSVETFSADFVWCLVTSLEQMTFPRPKGQAIVLQPFVVEPVEP